ncbi:MAG TPA: MFS transporter [Polyangia bacterium]|nr:MFS transporter [Polyangia bacterium]
MMGAPDAPPPPSTVPVGARAAVYALVVLTILNFVNYVDRYVLAAVLKPLHQDPAFRAVSDAQLGLLQTSFLVVYMIFSPIGGALGQRIKRKYIVAAGVGIWSLATLWSGAARSYGEMLAARALIGFGEAGYAAVAPALISDLFARDRRARMLSVFYVATPVGSALGFVLGGFVAQHWDWRHAFWVAGVPGLAFALLALFMAEPIRGVQDEPEPAPTAAAPQKFPLGAKWIYVTIGGALMTFTLGGLAFWAPTYFQEARALTVEQAGVWFGGLTVVAGVVGTLAGGFLSDAWARRDPGAHMKLSGIGLALGVPFTLLAPYVPGLTLTLAIFFVAEILVFLNTGPLNAALVASVSPRSRELAVGINILCIHLFGDAASPALLGRLNDLLVRGGMGAAHARSLSIASTALPLLLGGLVLLVGARTFRPRAE